jgi:hypothetical protein
MTDEDHKELDLLFAENERMKNGLLEIAKSPQELPKKISVYSKQGQGMLDGVRACANVAIRILKENENARKTETTKEA